MQKALSIFVEKAFFADAVLIPNGAVMQVGIHIPTGGDS